MNLSEHTKIREEKFGTVIFETLKEKVFVTNETGRDILNLLQEGHQLDKIVEILSNHYSAAETNIRDDVNNFIRQLKDNSLIKE